MAATWPPATDEPTKLRFMCVLLQILSLIGYCIMEFPALSRRTLLVTHVIQSVHMSILASSFLSPPPLSFLVTVSMLSVSLSLCFGNKFICVFF